MSPTTKSQIQKLLLGLVVLDLVLFSVCLFFPKLWFTIFHNAEYIDPQALLKRTGGVWIAFTLLQAYAYFCFEKKPHWLVLVAGVRMTELFSDWIYLASASHATWFAKLGLTIAPPANALMGWFLIKKYLEIQREKSSQSSSVTTSV